MTIAKTKFWTPPPPPDKTFCIRACTVIISSAQLILKLLFFLSRIIGDIGKQDADGFLFIVDRLKELIKYKAFQVAPASLEDILLRHESVADAGVVGIPDEAAGELPRAYVVKRPGTQVTEKDIQDFVAGMEVLLDFSCAGVCSIACVQKGHMQ